MGVWTVGEVRITCIRESEMPVAVEVMYPEAEAAEAQAMDWLKPHFYDAAGRVVLAIQALVVEAPSLTIVVDTCVGNEKQGRGLPAWNNLQTRFLEDFATAGFDLDAIDLVLCTHLHADHVGWNTHLVDGEWKPTFPKARHLLDRREYDYWKADADGETKAMMADSLAPIFAAGMVDFIDASQGHQVCGEVRLIPTPGHTPGHVSVLIQSKGQTALITGDFLHHPCQVTRTDWCAISDRDIPTAKATRRAMVEACAADGRLVIGTHFPGPTAGRIGRRGELYCFET